MLKFTELKNANRKDLREVLPLSKPFTLLVEPSSFCNFRCVQCFQSLHADTYFERTRMHMPLDRFKRILEQMRSWPGELLKVLKISLYGEPMLSANFSQILVLARQANIAERLESTSNVSLLTEEIAEAMVESQLDYLRVSIYAATPARFREVTGSMLSPERIYQNLELLQQIKKNANSERPFVSVKMLDSFDEENERFFELYRDVADELFLDKPHGWINVPGADFVKKLYGDKMKVAVQDRSEHTTYRKACPMPFTTMAVRANGDVSPCCVDFIGGTNLGNMEVKTLQELWESKEWCTFQELQLTGKNHLNSSCAHCDFYLSDHYTRDNIDGLSVERLLYNRKQETAL